MTIEIFWPILLTAILTGIIAAIGSSIGFAFSMTRKIEQLTSVISLVKTELKSDIRNLNTQFDNWKERCDTRHFPIDEKLKEYKTTTDTIKSTADKALSISRENADGLVDHLREVPHV